MTILNQGRFGMASALAGTMSVAINEAVEHANKRVQFGKSLLQHQNVQEKLSRMCVKQYVTEVSLIHILIFYNIFISTRLFIFIK